MRILTVCEYWDPDDLGGSGRVAQEVASQWANWGHDVAILGAGAEGSGVSTWNDIARVQFPFVGTVGLRAAREGFLASWKDVIALGAPDLVVVLQPMVALWTRRCLRESQIAPPTVYVFCSPWADEYYISRGNRSLSTRLGAGGRRLAERRALRGVGDIVVMSEFMHERLRSNHPNLRARVHHAPGGVSLQRFPFESEPTRHRDALGIPTDAPVLATVRRLVPRVGIDNLIRALAGAPSPLSEATLIVGGRGELREHLEQLAADLGVAERVQFRGLIPEEEMPLLIGAADLFVMPTKSLEGFGLATVEALACGTPVAVTPIGANPELLRDLDPALVLEGADPSDIQSGLNRLLEDPARLRNLRRKSRELVEQRYTWDHMARTILDCADS